MITKRILKLALGAMTLLASLTAGRAQWLTQSIPLKGGWNAVYLHVDSTYGTLQELVDADSSNPIDEIWMWNPAPNTQQFITSPQLPTDTGSQWVSWVRTLGPSSRLARLQPNSAYLVHIPNTVASYTWNLKGKAVPPQYQWTTTGLNFLGFPSNPSAAPLWDTFLAQQPDLQRNLEVYYYPGGDLGVSNPQRLFAYRSAQVNRGQAYWLRSGTVFNRYFAPFELSLQNSAGANFGDSLGQYRIRIKNLVGSSLNVTMTLIPSETQPAGQPGFEAMTPVLVRGPVNITNLTYGYSDLTATPKLSTLAAAGTPGAETEIIIGVNRSAMTGRTGAGYAGILRFTDSLGFSQVDVPVTATVGSKGGLWVGQASVSQVRNYLKNYERDIEGNLVIDSGGKYVVSSINTNIGNVARPYPLRLIVHNDSDGTNTVLLQRVYVGAGLATNQVIATREVFLHTNYMDLARRISAVHLPWSETNAGWQFSGEMRLGTNLTTTVTVDYNDQSSNPFVHTYHPDHDNLDATFSTVQPQGVESYTIQREITLGFLTPTDDFDALTTSAATLSGIYDESITILGRGTESKRFDSRGSFTLNRISDIGKLTTQ